LYVEGGDTHQKLHIAHPIFVDHQRPKSEWNVGGLYMQQIILETSLHRIIEFYVFLINLPVGVKTVLEAIKYEFPSHCIP
jgi:hypothetical protein